MATLAATLPRTTPQTRVLGASFSWWLLIAPALVLMLAFYAFPLAEVLWISFTEPEPGLGNYERLVTSAALQRVWMTTLRICVITTQGGVGRPIGPRISPFIGRPVMTPTLGRRGLESS